MANPSHSFILLIGDESALLLPPQHLPDADPIFTKSHDEKDSDPIIESISMASHLPVIILNDCGDQYYTHETIPNLSSIDKKKLIKRKLNEIYPDASYKTSVMHNNNKILMVGANETEPLEIWQKRLSKLSNSSGIVTLLPLESADILASLWSGAKDGWAILLSFHKTGGTRQIVTRDGEIVFTRLTSPMSEKTSVGYMSAAIAIDIKSTRDYLLRMGFSNETPLHLIAIMPENMHDAMNATPLDVATRHFFTPYDAALKLKLSLVPEKTETISDLIHALWLNKRSEPIRILAKEDKLKELLQIKIHKIGMATAIFFSLVAGVLIGNATLDFLKSQRVIYDIKYDINQLENIYIKQQEKITIATEPLNRLRLAVERKRLFKKENVKVIEILDAIKNAIGDDFRFYKMSWRNNNLTFVLRLTDDELIQKPITINKAEIKNRFKIKEQEIQNELNKINPKAIIDLIKPPFSSGKNKVISNEDDKEKEQKPIATYVIKWSDL